jgi:peroxiredoxin
MKKIKLMLVAAFTALFMSSAFAGGYDIGDKVKDFKLMNVDNTWVSLSDYSDSKGAIVIFTCNHCPYAKAYEQRIMDLDKMYASQGFPVIAINPNDPSVYEEDSFENMQKRSKEKGYSFPYLFDEEQTVYPEFGAAKTPHIYVLAKGQKGWTVEYIGAIDNNYQDADAADEKYVSDAVTALLAGDKPAITETKAIGCSIKAKKK